MKIKVAGNRLQEGLKNVISVANAKISPTILGNVLVDAENGKLTLTASNLDITLNTSVECEVVEAGKTTVPAKMFQNILNALPSGIVEIDVNESDKMRVIAGESSFRISGINAKDFPKIAKVKEDAVYTADAKDLKKGLRKTSYAQSLDDTRKVLNGVLFDFAENYLKTVATDGRRLSLSLVKAEWKCADAKFTLPRDAVREIQRILPDEGKVTIRFSNGISVFSFEASKTVMYAKVVDDAYPNYAHVIPTDVKSCAQCDRARLLDMMNRAKVMAVENVPSVKLTFSKGVLDANVIGLDDGEGRDKFAVKYDGEKVEFAFNPYYFHEAVSVLDSDNVRIEIESDTRPILIKGEEDDGLAILMPLRRG